MEEPFHIDYDREQRLGFPEIVFGESKPADILLNILKNYQSNQKNALVTRLQPEKAKILRTEFPDALYDSYSGAFLLKNLAAARTGEVAIVAGGTSDLFIVNEIYYTLSYLGIGATRIVDVGVSGLHRLMGTAG